MKKLIVTALVAGSLFIASPASASRSTYISCMKSHTTTIRLLPSGQEVEFGRFVVKAHDKWGFTRLKLVNLMTKGFRKGGIKNPRHDAMGTVWCSLKHLR